jgi:ribonuclease VapC
VIVDTSALVAVALQEPGFDNLIGLLERTPFSGIGTPTLVETGMVLSARLGGDGRNLVSQLLYEFELVPVPFGDDHWREAIVAFERYGRGRHPARLNFGDCMSYAVARLAGEPLLFVGDDFRATDIVAA